jgi:hypothetical protein
MEFVRLIRELRKASDGITISEGGHVVMSSERLHTIRQSLEEIESILEDSRPSRILLYEEAKYILESEKSLIYGPIRVLDDEQEFLVKAFLKGLVEYFHSSQVISGQTAYYHELRRLLLTFQGFIEDVGSRRRGLDSTEVLYERLRGNLDSATSILTDRWADVARAYAGARHSLLSPDNLASLSDLAAILG